MIGSRLGKWVLDREIGRGGMGRVYLAHEEPGGRRAAVKVLASALAQEAGFLERFQREIDALSQLEHPNIVRLYESGVQDGRYYYAMEYVEGENLEQILHEKGRLPWKEVLEVALQVCPALKHAHDRGIIHRDLKPPNLMRTPAGVIKLTDFGIAKVFAARHLTKTGGVVGTAEYLSPEQAAGKLATKRSDLYSLGVVLYTLVTGRTPFEGQSTADLLHKHLYARFDRPQKLVPDLPHEFDGIICQLLEKDPADRPGDGLVLQRQLESLRRKLARKSQPTLLSGPADRTLAENRPEELPASDPGPATLMSRLVRDELERQKRGGPFQSLFNRPWVVVPLFLLCVGALVWAFAPRPTLSPEDLFTRGSQLMASADPADWDRAWSEYLEPLAQDYPSNPYHAQVEAYRQQIEDRAAQQRALASLKARLPAGEAQRFYQRGLRLCQEGDPEAARQLWQNVVRTFAGLESETRWVKLAEAGLAELARRAPPEGERRHAVREALERARRLRDQGRRRQAEEIWQGLEALYGGDPSAQEVLSEIRRDRGR
jgi:serine/threonine-protein kinase